jgi:hypothetical protein
LLKEKLQNFVFFIVFLSAGDCAKYHPIFEALKKYTAPRRSIHGSSGGSSSSSP